MRNLLLAACLTAALASQAADTIADKLVAVYAAVTNIGAAISEKGVPTNGLALADYADAIRRIGGSPIPPMNPDWGYRLTVGDYNVDVYTNTTVAMTWTVPSGVTSADYLVIGGGGGGGAGIGAGGGAGGTLAGSLDDLAATYYITVGAGGDGGVSASPRVYYARGTNGVQSALGGIVALGGGGGASYKEAGVAGGSGGGGSSDVPRAGYGRGTSGQGYDGGYATVADKGAGGGGGAGGIGENGNGTLSGDGGDGITSDITGVSSQYAGGGGGFGGGAVAAGHGQYGGGDGGHDADGLAATSPGSGGGGATVNRRGGRGANGIVVVRYRKP